MYRRIISLIVIISIIIQMTGMMNVYASDEPEVVKLNCTNEAGDYTYFDNHFCITGVTPGYRNNFAAYPKDNYIKLHRIDYDNPKRRDYIYLEKVTDNDCYFDINCTKRLGYTGDSAKRYRYFIIQGDFYTTQPEVDCQMFLLRDSTSDPNTRYNHVSSVILKDGSIRSGNEVYSGYKVRRCEWFNYKLAVNLDTNKADIYINDEFVQQQTINSDFKNLDMVRFSVYGGKGDMYIDNFSVTGLVKPYENGTDTLTDVFPDNDETIKQFLEGKVAMHCYGGLMYKDGVKERMTPKPLYDKDEEILYVSADSLNRAFGMNLSTKAEGLLTGEGISIDGEGNVTYEGRSIRLSVQPIISADSLMVPVMEFAKEVLGKYVFYHESGIVVIGDKNQVLDTKGWKYGSFREVIGNYTMLNDIDFLSGFLGYMRPDEDMLRRDFASVTGEFSAHPRILLNQSQFDHLSELYSSDDTYRFIADKIIAVADSYYYSQPLVYKFDDSMRMYATGDGTQRRFMYWGYAYKITGDDKYVKRAVKELKALDTFPDFNPLHIIDTGMFCMGLAVAYDWFYDAYTEEERQLAERVCYEKCLLPLSKAYYGRISELTSGMGTVRWMSNYNAVVSGGALNAAIATIECNPEYNIPLIANCIRSLEYTLMGLMPDGGWNESISYWNYTHEFLAYAAASLDTAFGTSYGIKESQGMESSVEYAMSCIGIGGINNYHDAGGGTASTLNSYKTFMYLANAYGKYDAYGMRMYDLLNKRTTFYPEDGMFYNSDIDDYTSVYDKNGTAVYTGGTEVFSIRDTYDRDKSKFYFSTHFGTTSGYHQHNDCGAFVLDMYGTRFADDLGADDYNLQNELKYKSWELYRYRAEGHNVIVFEPKNYVNGFEQVTGVFAPIIDCAYNDSKGYLYADMTDVYSDVSSMRTGYYADKDKMSVTMRSEFTTIGGREVYWFMHTRADIDIDEKNNCAILSRNGHKVCVRFDTNGSNAQIMEMEAAPFPYSPQVSLQNPNTGYRKVAIRFDANGVTDFTVNICGAEFADLPMEKRPLTFWSLADGEAGDDAVVANLCDYQQISSVAKCTATANNGIFGKACDDESARIPVGENGELLSVDFEESDMGYTVAGFEVNTSGAEVCLTNLSGTPYLENISFAPDRWNNLYVIRRNSDGRVLTVINGEYGIWQNSRTKAGGIKLTGEPKDSRAYIDVDNIRIYHTDAVPEIKVPDLNGIETDGEFAVNAGGKTVENLTSDGTVRVFENSEYARVMDNSEYLTDGNVIVTERDGIYKYFVITTQPMTPQPQLMHGYVEEFEGLTMARGALETVDDVTGAYGKCVKAVGDNTKDGSTDANNYFNFNLPKTGIVTTIADVYLAENCSSVRFAKSGHIAISRRILASELNFGEWSKLTLVTDIDNGRCDLYINGVYDSSMDVGSITCVRIIFDRDTKASTKLSDMTVYADNIAVYQAGINYGILSMDKCTIEGTAIMGAVGMTVAEFAAQCNLTNYKQRIEVYGRNSLLGGDRVLQTGDSVYYYCGNILGGRYIIK